MAEPIDFPTNPTVGQHFNAPNGSLYVWNGSAWDVSGGDPATQYPQVGKVLSQCRVLLMDTDDLSYRYDQQSLISNLNICLFEIRRLRPDLFLATKFLVPQYTTADMEEYIYVDEQYVSAMVYYVVGMAQLRDDEETQDKRAGALLKQFTNQLVGVS